MVSEELQIKLNEILKQCKGYPEDTINRLENFLINMLEDYSKTLGLTQVELIVALEKGRTYSAPNYYQECKFPSIDKVKIFETIDDFKNYHADKGFRCPSCAGISSNPQKCNANPTECNWTSYGLLGCAGKGFYFMCKDFLLNNEVKVYEIFMPVNLENSKNLELSI